MTAEVNVEKLRKKRKSPAGVATNDLIFSAMVGSNAELFPQILQLYVPAGARVADTTFGKGVFWRNVSKDVYTLHATDLQMGVDARKLPYADGSLDCVVFDPPYMHSEGGGAHAGHQKYDAYYRNDARSRTDFEDSGLKGHFAVVDLYKRASVEAWRVLAPLGIYIVKCQDEVYANRQRLTHVELINAYEALGFEIEDLFVLVTVRRPGVSRLLRQYHARKIHSYYIVARKPRRMRVSSQPAT